MKFCHRLSLSSKKETLQLVGGARTYVQGQILAGEGRGGGEGREADFARLRFTLMPS